MVWRIPELSILELILAGREVDSEVDLSFSSQNNWTQFVAVEAQQNHPRICLLVCSLGSSLSGWNH